MEADAFAADSNMSTDTAPPYPWSGTLAEVHQPGQLKSGFLKRSTPLLTMLLLVRDCLFVRVILLVSQLAFISEGHSPIRHLGTRPIAVSSAKGYELWNGITPNLNHLRIFGSKAYVYNTRIINKFEQNALEGIFPQIEKTNDHHVNEDDLQPSVSASTLRTSQRSTKGIPPQRYSLHANYSSIREPLNWNELVNLPLDEKKEWLKASEEEMKSLIENDTWTLTDLPPGKKAIGCKWIFKAKCNQDGNVEMFKARLVAKGFDQKYGEDYNETFAPVSKLTTSRTMFSIAASKKLTIRHYDIKKAFLYGELMEEIYMDQPEVYIHIAKENLVCKLKSIYGLKQSKRSWPDISSAIGILSRRVVKPNEHDWKELKRILGYLKSTLDLVLVFETSSSVELTGYTDADWASPNTKPLTVACGLERVKTGSTTQWHSHLAPNEMGAFYMRNRHHVPLQTWNTNAAHSVSLDQEPLQGAISRASGDFELDNEPRGKPPQKFEDAELQALLDEDSTQTQENFAKQLQVSQGDVSLHLNSLGMTQKLSRWVPHELSESQQERRLVTCERLLAKHEKKSFLHQIVTSDEKWFHFSNPMRQKSWGLPGQFPKQTPRPYRFGKKAMLCVWWDQTGVVYFELLKPGKTVNTSRYEQKMHSLREALNEKRPVWREKHNKRILQHDNAPAHNATVVKNTIKDLGWELLPHPPYSPDLAPSDYHLFTSLGHALKKQEFSNSTYSENGLLTGQLTVQDGHLGGEDPDLGRHLLTYMYWKQHIHHQGYGGAASVLMLESAAKASASMLGTASNYRQSQTFTKVCLDHGAMINESCTPTPHSMRSDVDLHAASPVAQNKQGRGQDLGRGFCPISIIQSPQTSNFAASKQLRILQCNINGLCSTATKIKLEEIMEIAEKQRIQIIALQETKLNEKYNLKYKNYNILRKDRNKEGGGLAFLITNLYYEDIAINIPNTSDLEAQGIKVYLSQNKTINIFNMYHPPNNKLIDDGTMAQFLTDNTIIVGDLNAKHQLWGCSMPNPRGKILSNIFDDNAFMCLNDGNSKRFFGPNGFPKNQEMGSKLN
ncbi:hypothetical protein LAZ67_12001936 [Cordylochernes scorpioides]|uniref:Uncharacterized protein n=1 Tax=Cordylochernes scorpioides TaxID=51811 RepID=A0ABY6L3W1_9ARAC|nr:hypothetical protein LAZ67_12001936 [Cordylochernes scorpioides]